MLQNGTAISNASILSSKKKLLHRLQHRHARHAQWLSKLPAAVHLLTHLRLLSIALLQERSAARLHAEMETIGHKATPECD